MKKNLSFSRFKQVRKKKVFISSMLMQRRNYDRPPSPCGQGAKYAHRCPTCRMMRLKGFHDGSVSTTWDCAGLLCNLYSLGYRDRDAVLSRCHHSQTSRAQSPLTIFYIWCNMLLTAALHPPSRARQLGAIIIIILGEWSETKLLLTVISVISVRFKLHYNLQKRTNTIEVNFSSHFRKRLSFKTMNGPARSQR